MHAWPVEPEHRYGRFRLPSLPGRLQSAACARHQLPLVFSRHLPRPEGTNEVSLLLAEHVLCRAERHRVQSLRYWTYVRKRCSTVRDLRRRQVPCVDRRLCRMQFLHAGYIFRHARRVKLHIMPHRFQGDAERIRELLSLWRRSFWRGMCRVSRRVGPNGIRAERSILRPVRCRTNVCRWHGPMLRM